MVSDEKRPGITSRLAQRSGFVIMIGLLVLSTVMAWRIQESFSERSFEIHRRYVQEQDLLTSLRRTLWGAGIALRDHYLHPAPDRRGLDEQLDAFTNDSKRYLSELRRITTHREQVRQLDLQYSELWSKTRAAAEQNLDPSARFHFIQTEIVPRRDQAGRLLRDIEKANRSSLTDSETELRESRAGAAARLLGVLGACLFCGILVAWFSTRRAERLERESLERFHEVLTAKQQLEELSARLMEVQEEERTRLSRELHDEVVQNLAVMKMEIVQAESLAALRTPEAGEALARARRLAEETVQNVRDISLLLRPSLLDDLGLGPALQWQAEEFSRRTGVPCSLQEEALSEELPEAVKTCVYRVTQEALRNCEKHSTAATVRVVVRQTGQELEVTIEDDGKGFAGRKRTPSSLGLLGMRERALSLGGSIDIGDREEGGARIRMLLPVPAARSIQITGALV